MTDPSPSSPFKTMTSIDRRSFLAGGLALAAPTSALAMQDEGEGEDLSLLGKTPHTRFAVNIEMWWRKQPFLERIVMAAEYGFPAVEFWPWLLAIALGAIVLRELLRWTPRAGG